ncbi:DUF998 domain-containing protein [Brevibacterium sp. LS14]|nr:DUF998 domain-containing protein [Brevibacterium sp. LS14]QZE26759.1 DUF998 domain-containing protein [Brevibacterium casei]
MVGMRESLLVPERQLRIAGICWAGAGLVYLLAEAAAASAFPNYSYAVNYVSDLGVPDVEVLAGRRIDSPLWPVMTLGFGVQGVLFALGAVLAVRSSRQPLGRVFVVFALVHGLGMVVIAAVHGGQATIAAGLGWVHLLGAGLALLGGQAAVIVAGAALLRRRGRTSTDVRLGAVSIALGVVGFLGIVMLEIDVRVVAGTILADGVWERIGFYAIIAWELLIGVALTARRPDPRGIGAP